VVDYYKEGSEDMQLFDKNKIDGFLFVEGNDGIRDFGANHHSNIEILLLLEGEMRVWVENKGVFTARAGDAIVVFPNQQYRYETQKKEKYMLLTADIKRLTEYLGVLSSYSPVSNVVKGASEDSEVLSLAKSIVKAYADEKNGYRDTVIKGYVTAFVGRILSMTELKKNELESLDTAGVIAGFCNLRYKEKLSLEVLERELHISKFYISHVINERLGVSFNDYVNSIRINEACRLMLESDKPLKEISREVGFGTVRTFDRVFKRQKGETAREYRERNSIKNE
jgi:YesN/AraC family two-component response regulator